MEEKKVLRVLAPVDKEQNDHLQEPISPITITCTSVFSINQKALTPQRLSLTDWEGTCDCSYHWWNWSLGSASHVPTTTFTSGGSEKELSRHATQYSKQEIVDLGREKTTTEEMNKIDKPSVGVSTDSDRCRDLQERRLRLEYLAGWTHQKSCLHIL